MRSGKSSKRAIRRRRDLPVMPPAQSQASERAETVEIHLADILDSEGAARLATELRCVRGHAAKLDASQVRLLAASCLQVLISARKTWALDCKPWRIENPSRAFSDALALYAADELKQPLVPPGA